jgi:hypothetical protein
MKLSILTPLSSVAPVALANPQASAVGVAATAMRSDAKPQVPNPAAPSTQAFGDVAAQGAGTGFATDTHKHAMPTTWTKVAAGTLGAVASLSFTGLAGYRRYHLLVACRPADATPLVVMPTLKLNNSAAHYTERAEWVNGVLASAAQTNVATARLASGANARGSGPEHYDITVMHDDQGARETTFVCHFVHHDMSATDIAALTFGTENTAVASITEILLAFPGVLTDGEYVLYGSNEVA